MAEASKFYCQKCSRATLYIGQKPKYCANCGLNFLNGTPASSCDSGSFASVDSDNFEITSSANEISQNIEIDNSPVQSLPIDFEPDVVEKLIKPKKRGRPKKEKQQNDLSWFAQSAGTLRPNFRKH